MDPKTCLENLAHALEGDQIGDAVEALNAYYQWRLKGGFEPPHCGSRGLPGDQYADELANDLCDKAENLVSLIPSGTIVSGTDM